MVEHTPTPWVLEDSDMLFAKDGRLIGDLRFLATPDHRANGAFIVKAVNNHEALVGALRFILAFYEPGQTYLDTEAWKQAEAGARRALKNATDGDVGGAGK